MDSQIEIKRETEHYQGFIRLKMSVSNKNSFVVTDVTLDFIYEDSLLKIDNYGPTNYEVKNSKVLMGNINGGTSKSIAVYFDPLMCTGSADINCQVNFRDAQGELCSVFMERKIISVLCPIIKTEYDINVGRLKELIENLPSRDSKIYEIHHGFNINKIASIAREVIEKRDVRHIRTLKTIEGEEYEIWYYGRTKIKTSDIVIKISISSGKRLLELFVATESIEVLTGLLAELGRDLKDNIESRATGKNNINITIRNSMIQRSNLLDLCNSDGTCPASISVEDSMLLHTNILSRKYENGDEKKVRKEEEKQDKLPKQQEEKNHVRIAEDKEIHREKDELNQKNTEKQKTPEETEETEERQKEEERKREEKETLDAEDVVSNTTGEKIILKADSQTTDAKEISNVTDGKLSSKQGNFYTGKLTELPKDRTLKYAKICWSVLVVVLALVAAAYLGSYGDHATPAPATPISLASFNTNTTSGHAPLDVQFTTLSENKTLVNWDFGDGNTSIEQNPKHTYFTPGKYTVNLTASNGNITNSTLTTISVRAAPFAYILGNTVSVVDIATDNVVGTIDVPFNSEVVAVTPDGSKIYMAKLGNISTGNNTDISVIDTATNTITANVFVGSYPYGIAVTPDGTKVYLTISNDYSNPFPNTVSVIDTSTDTVETRINVGSQPHDVAVTPDGKKAYVTDWNNTVSVIDTSTNTITDTFNIDSATDQDLFRIKISPDGKKAYLINECGDTVSIIDTATNTITATVTAGRVLSGVITPDGTKVYVANYRDDNVSVIDTATNTIIATMNVGKGPFAIAVTMDGKKVYVANRYSNNVSVIDTATNRVTATVSVGEEPCDVSIAPDGKKVYVPNYNDGTFSVIDTSTDTVTTTVPLGQNPEASIIR